jgi:uncharacterized membrane protein
VATIAADSKWVREIRFQYTALMLPGLMLASQEVLAAVWRRRQTLGRILMGWVLLCSVGAAMLRGPLPGGVGFSSWKLTDPAKESLDRAVAQIPADAHLSHRRGVYDFPNPFTWMIYGASEADAAQPTDADWVLVQPELLSAKHRAVFDELIADDQFDTVFDENGVVVLKRADVQP